jgi:hypothetical protein
MSGVYWALTALSLMNVPASHFCDEDKLVAWVLSCYKPDEGSFAPNTHHDGNMLSTLSAVQIMALLGRLEELDERTIATCAHPFLAFSPPGITSVRISFCAPTYTQFWVTCSSDVCIVELSNLGIDAVSCPFTRQPNQLLLLHPRHA